MDINAMASIVATTVSLFSLVISVKVWRRANPQPANGDFKSLSMADDNSAKQLREKSGQSAALEAVLGSIESRTARLEGKTERSPYEVCAIRFDAFEDIGGKQSFAVAFINSDGDGVVVSGINGRNESRTYAKPIEQGESFFKLSAEEAEAIAGALSRIGTDQ